MPPRHKSSDAGNSDMLKRSHKVLPLNEKVEVLDLLRKEKNHMLKLLRPYGNNKSYIYEIMSQEKNVLVLVLYLKLQKL